MSLISWLQSPSTVILGLTVHSEPKKIKSGIKPRPPALGVHSLSHWTTREVLCMCVCVCVCVCVCACVYREGLSPFIQESGSWYPTPERKGIVEA